MRYTRRPPTVSAVQVEPTSFNGLTFIEPPFSKQPKWLLDEIRIGGIVRNNIQSVLDDVFPPVQWVVYTTSGPKLANAYDYIVYEDGKVDVYTERDFHDTFQPVKEPF